MVNICDRNDPFYKRFPTPVADQIYAHLQPLCNQMNQMVWMLPDADSIIPGRSDCQAGDKPCFDGFSDSWGP
ncbi:MAG: hypothetical protein V4510_07410 [bacterium]